MADQWIGDLTRAESMNDEDLLVISQLNQAKSITWETFIADLAEKLDGHGGIASITYTPPETGSVEGSLVINYADGTSTEPITLTNGVGINEITDYWGISESAEEEPSEYSTTPPTVTEDNRFLWHYTAYALNNSTEVETNPTVVGVFGLKGDTGDAWHTYIRYSNSYPTSDTDMKTTPDDWIGIYAGTDAIEDLGFEDFDWYEIKGEQGEPGTDGINGIPGNGVVSITRASSPDAESGTNHLRYTYTVTYTDGTTTTYKGFDGNGIESISQSRSGLTVTYTINFSNGDTFAYPVKDGTDGAGSVSTVDSIQASQGDVALLTISSSPPSASAGQVKARWYDQTAQKLYICTAQSGSTYVWSLASSSVVVDATLSLSSENAVQNKVLSALLGFTALPTTAQTITGAIEELNTQINGTGGLDERTTDLETLFGTQIIKTTGRITVPTGSTGVTKAVEGLTADHELLKWNFFTAASGGSAIAENNPPQDMEWSTGTGTFTLKTSGSNSIYCQPVFILPTSVGAT